MNGGLSKLWQKDGTKSVLASLISILIGMAVGGVIILVVGVNNPNLGLSGAWEGIRLVFGGLFSTGRTAAGQLTFGFNSTNVGNMFFRATPLILTGLSVAVAFKTGLFNIGAAGQYTLGAYGALYCAIVLHLPWYVGLIASAVLGGIWGAIPGLFKAYLNINEVITSIMFNWIGLYLVNEIIYGNGTGVMYDSRNTRTWNLRRMEGAEGVTIPDFGLNDMFQTNSTTIAIFLSIVVAILIWVVLDKTTFGYELKAVGLNKNAARYAGINEKKNLVLSMVIAGALAGFGAGLYYLSGVSEWNPLNSTTLPAMGFNGISVALLASSNPIGTIFSALFISHITVGGSFLSTRYYPTEVADLISGIIIYLCAFSMLFRGKIAKLLSGGKRADKSGEKEG